MSWQASAENERESCDRCGELEKRGEHRRELTRNKWKKGKKKRPRSGEGLADKLVTSVWFSAAQLSSPGGAEVSSGQMDHPGRGWQSRHSRQTWRGRDGGMVRVLLDL